MPLTQAERWIISNQLLILEKLTTDKSEASYYENTRIAVERGYMADVRWDMEQSISEHALTEAECLEVIHILSMFQATERSFAALDDKSGVEEWTLKFKGFDGNGNGDDGRLGYVRYMVEKLHKFTDLTRGDDYNSHFPMLDAYRRMLSKWESLGKPHELMKEQLIAIAQSRSVGRPSS